MNLFLLAVLAAQPGASDPPALARISRPSTLSPRTALLLSIAVDGRFTPHRRSLAVREVGMRRESAAVPKLVAMLPGECGVLTLQVINALSLIGDLSALPALERMEADAEKAGLDLPGKIRAVLHGTIDRLKKNR